MRMCLHAALLTGAGLVSSCGGAPDVVLRGSVTVRERIALPPNAVVHVGVSDVSVQDVATPVLAETKVATGGRQVPIPFELRLPASAVDPQRTYAVRATIQSGDETLFTTDTATLVLTRGNPTTADLVLVRASDGFPKADPSAQFTVPGSTAGRLFAASGDKLRFLACDATGDGIPLTDTPDALGATLLRELGAGPQGIVVLVRLEGTRLEEVRYAGLEGPRCEDLPPPGDVEARGNEPFWSLRVDGAESWFRTPESQTGERVTGGGWTRVKGGWMYEVPRPAGPLLTLVLTPERCSDSMSGARYPYRAVLVRDGKRYEGCALEGRAAQARATGGAQESPLAGTKWRLVDLGGTPALDTPAATLEFSETGQVTGSGACNRFNGAVEITGTALSFGPLATTRMTCAAPIDAQEKQYFAALNSATGFTLEGSSLLVHFDGRSGGPLRFARQ